MRPTPTKTHNWNTLSQMVGSQSKAYKIFIKNFARITTTQISVPTVKWNDFNKADVKVIKEQVSANKIVEILQRHR